MQNTVLTESDYNLFYKSIIYGNIEDSISTSIKSAYRDVCRTITGFSKCKDHDTIYDDATKLLHDEISCLSTQNITNQDVFNEWHKNCCDKLIKKFKNQRFCYGQAQKWVNMSFKNLSIIDHKLVEKQYEFFHIPIDNYIINITGIKTSVAWSRISDYNEYIDYQEQFRNKYEGIPLDNEFKLWLKVKKNFISTSFDSIRQQANDKLMLKSIKNNHIKHK